MKIMFVFIYVTLGLINYVLFVKNKNSRLVEFLSIILLLVIMGGNTLCADYEDYQTLYESQDYPLLWEPGYVSVANFFSSSGLSFFYFRFGLFALALILILVATKSITKTPHLLLIVYLSIFVVLDTVQMRNTLAVAFLFLGTVLLSRGKKLLFVFCLVIASLFHSSFIVFTPLLFYTLIIALEKKHRKLILIIFSVLSIITASGSFYFIKDVVTLVNETKIDYLNSTWFNLVYLLLPLFYFFVADKSRKLIEKAEVGIGVKNFSDIVYAIGILFIFYMPILATSHDFARVIRDAGAEIVSLISIVYFYKKRGELCYNRQNWKSYSMLLLLFLIIWLVGLQYWQGYDELFNNNIIYSYL